MKPTRISKRFDALRKDGKKGFIAYITAGDPGLKQTVDIVRRLEDAGADLIELGVPFSDPLADGPANQLAAERALSAGTSMKGILDAVNEIREKSEIPLLFFSYMNPLYAHGFEKTIKRAAKAGIDGVLMVDISMEESGPYSDILEANNLDHVPLVTPTTPDQRMKQIVRTASGFVYAVSRTGVTGEQTELQKDASAVLRKANRHSTLPVALGFGISTPKQARSYAELTDAVVVGSHIVTTFFKAGNSARGRAAATREIKKLIDAVKQV